MHHHQQQWSLIEFQYPRLLNLTWSLVAVEKSQKLKRKVLNKRGCNCNKLGTILLISLLCNSETTANNINMLLTLSIINTILFYFSNPHLNMRFIQEEGHNEKPGYHAVMVPVWILKNSQTMFVVQRWFLHSWTNYVHSSILVLFSFSRVNYAHTSMKTQGCRICRFSQWIFGPFRCFCFILTPLYPIFVISDMILMVPCYVG